MNVLSNWYPIEKSYQFYSFIHSKRRQTVQWFQTHRQQATSTIVYTSLISVSILQTYTVFNWSNNILKNHSWNIVNPSIICGISLTNLAMAYLNPTFNQIGDFVLAQAVGTALGACLANSTNGEDAPAVSFSLFLTLLSVFLIWGLREETPVRHPLINSSSRQLPSQHFWQELNTLLPKTKVKQWIDQKLFSLQDIEEVSGPVIYGLPRLILFQLLLKDQTHSFCFWNSLESAQLSNLSQGLKQGSCFIDIERMEKALVQGADVLETKQEKTFYQEFTSLTHPFVNHAMMIKESLKCILSIGL